MPPRVKADENMPRTIVQVLRERGQDAVSVVEQNMGGQGTVTVATPRSIRVRKS
jgi:hypothetical protein